MKKNKRKKVGLALGSGGARGFCHLGVLKVLEENNIPIDVMSGCSMGSIIGGCYAAGISVEAMLELTAKLSQRMIVDLDLTLKRQGMLRGNRALAMIRNLIGDKTFEECVIPFVVTAVEIQKPELIVIKSGKLTDAIRASMSVPAAFQYVETPEGEHLIDGGVMQRIPIPAVKELGAEIVIAVDAIGKPEENYDMKGILDMVERSYTIIDWESSKEKMKEADFVITPEQGNRSMYVFKNNMESVEAGEAAAREALPQIKELLKL
jgi:NTE family protein